ncbi:MAG: hypothetical protein FH749_02565 [Firmicutes bacterium]|nr:hypothetical protein [Bacillota bacterium]
MKKVLTVLLMVLLGSAVLIAGCGSNDQGPANDLGDQNQNGTQNGDPVDEENTDNEPLADLLGHFEQHGFTVGEETLKDYSMLGAVDGFGIELDGEDVEFYLFDPATDDPDAQQLLEDARTKGTITMWEITFPALINGDILMINHDEHSKQEDIETTFNSF